MTLKVFVSYCHVDKAFRNSLKTFLASLEREEAILTWLDQCIMPGEDIDESISLALSNSDLVILLVSQDFIASSYCYTKEMKAALDMHEAGRCRVVPIIIRPCDWMSLPIGRLLALPEDAVPVSTWPNQDLAWTNIASALRSLIKVHAIKNNLMV